MANVKVKIESWNDVPAERKRALLLMTLNDGMMRDYVRKASPIIMTAYLMGEYKGKRVGWAAYDFENGPAMFFVNPKYRKKGVGQALVKEVVKIAKDKNAKVLVYPHDYKSESLFEKAAEDYKEVKESCTSHLEHKFKYGSHYSSSLKHPRKPWK